MGRGAAEIVTLPMPRRIDAVGAAEKADQSTMGGRMSFARLRKGLTQEELSKRLGKSRVTIVQYEAGNIQPPIDVVEQAAKALDVPASYLAYGEATVPVVGKAGIDMVSFTEHRIGRDGSYPASAIALGRDLVESYNVEPEALAAYALNHDAPEFGLRSGDRMFVNTAITKPDGESDLYLLKSGSRLEVVRVEPDLTSKGGNTVKMTGPKGQHLSAKIGELEFIGAIVATLRRQ